MIQEIKRCSKNIFSYYFPDWNPNIKRNLHCKLPGHEDKHPSLSIYETDGEYRFKCFGCDRSGDSIELIKLIEVVDYKGAIEIAKDILRFQSKPKPKIIATYDYTDEKGKLLYQEVRFNPKDFRLRRPDGKGGWIYNLKGVRFVPYRLSEVLKAETVFITEGPKDADNLRKLGLTATTNAMGAGKWKKAYNQFFKNKNIIILPDNDSIGEKHALEVAKNLYAIAKSVKIIDLPGLAEKGDISDWLEQGHTKDELLWLVKKTPEFKPTDYQISNSKINIISIEDFLSLELPPSRFNC